MGQRAELSAGSTVRAHRHRVVRVDRTDRAAVVELLRARLAGAPQADPGRPGDPGRLADPCAGEYADDADPGGAAAGSVSSDGGHRDRVARRRLAAATVRAASAPAVDPGQVLAVSDPLTPLLPEGGLRRGSVVSLISGPGDPLAGLREPGSAPGATPAGPGAGTTSLLLALLSRPSAGGSWAAVVGVPGLGGLAAAEAGVDLARLALVPSPGPGLGGIAAALLDGVDLVALADPERLSAPERSRLTARARQRGTVLLPLGVWPGADVVLRCAGSRWAGLRRADGGRPGGGGPAGAASGGAGSGRLRQREVLVSSAGRRGAVPVSARLLLPAAPSPVGTGVVRARPVEPGGVRALSSRTGEAEVSVGTFGDVRRDGQELAG